MPELFPEQLDGQIAVLFQLLPDTVEVGLGALGEICGRLVLRMKGFLQTLFVPLFAKRPFEAGVFHARQVLMHRTLADARAAGDLPLAELLLEVQPQNLFNLSHGLSLSGQLRPALL